MYTQQTAEKRLDALFNALVPCSGKAATLAGEIVRAICRIEYRNWNDGDHLGIGYGKETCNAAGRFLEEKCGGKVGECVSNAWGIRDEDAYDVAVAQLEIAVCEHLDKHPELQDTPNEEDMWDWFDKDEDVDDSGKDDDDEWY